MKKLSIVSAALSFGCVFAASAANITIYHSPSCPHCHHAREFINGTLIKEMPSVTVTEINVMEQKNLDKFRAALKKCEYQSGGVPVIVIGEKCFQGYADFMQQDLRDAVTAADKASATDDEKPAATDGAANDATTDDTTVAPIADNNAIDASNAATPSKSKWWMWGLALVLVAGLGGLLIKTAGRK
ncbi:hypothetical protein HDR66_03290 [bacterium]|nr:hypothetical protein [bacterium]